MVERSDSTQERESGRLLRVQLRSVLSGAARSLIVTSPYESMEKSRVTSALAGAVAEEGLKILLVESDAANPVPSSSGPLEAGARSWSDDPEVPLLATENGIQHAQLDPALRPDEIRMSLSRWTSRFDHVIINGPPLLELAHAITLASCVDATLLVIDAGRVATRDLERTRFLLQRAGASLVGSVLAGVGRTR